MEEKSLKETLNEINQKLDEQKENKQQKFKLPFKAKVGNAKVKRGYVIVEVINENKGIDFEKVPVIDGTIKLNDTFHAIKEDDIFIYKGKPFLHLAKNKLNPFNPLDGANETYGQKYVMARMKSDFISGKKKMGMGAMIAGLAVVGLIAYVFFMG